MNTPGFQAMEASTRPAYQGTATRGLQEMAARGFKDMATQACQAMAASGILDMASIIRPSYQNTVTPGFPIPGFLVMAPGSDTGFPGMAVWGFRGIATRGSLIMTPGSDTRFRGITTQGFLVMAVRGSRGMATQGSLIMAPSSDMGSRGIATRGFLVMTPGSVLRYQDTARVVRCSNTMLPASTYLLPMRPRRRLGPLSDLTPSNNLARLSLRATCLKLTPTLTLTRPSLKITHTCPSRSRTQTFTGVSLRLLNVGGA